MFAHLALELIPKSFLESLQSVVFEALIVSGKPLLKLFLPRHELKFDDSLLTIFIGALLEGHLSQVFAVC